MKTNRDILTRLVSIQENILNEIKNNKEEKGEKGRKASEGKVEKKGGNKSKMSNEQLKALSSSAGFMRVIVDSVNIFSNKLSVKGLNLFVSFVKSMLQVFGMKSDQLRMIRAGAESFLGTMKLFTNSPDLLQGIKFLNSLTVGLPLKVITLGPLYEVASRFLESGIGVFVRKLLNLFDLKLNAKTYRVDAALQGIVALRELGGFLPLKIIALGPLYRMAALFIPFTIKPFINALLKAFVFDKTQKVQGEQAYYAMQTIKDLTGWLPLKIILMAPLYMAAIPFVLVIRGFVSSILFAFKPLYDKKNQKNLNNATQTIKNVAIALGLSLLAIIGVGMVAMASGETIAKTVGMVLGFIGLFWLISKIQKPIMQGTKAVASMAISMGLLGLGLFTFSGFIAASAENLANTNPIAAFLGSIAAISAFGLVFYFVGKVAGTIAKGSLAMAAIGLSLMVFAAGLKEMQTLTDAIYENTYDFPGGGLVEGLTKTIGSLVLIGGFALVYYAVGSLGFASILKGTLAIAAMGLSLRIFAWGLSGITDVFKDIFSEKDAQGISKMTPDSLFSGGVVLGGMFGTIIGLGLVFVGAGLALPLIAPGAITFGIMGLSLMVFAAGVSVAFSLLKKVEEEAGGENFAEQLKTLFRGVFDAFTIFTDPSGETETGGIGAGIVGLISTVFRLGRFAIGVGLVLMASFSLVVMSGAISLAFSMLRDVEGQEGMPFSEKLKELFQGTYDAFSIFTGDNEIDSGGISGLGDGILGFAKGVFKLGRFGLGVGMAILTAIGISVMATSIKDAFDKLNEIEAAGDFTEKLKTLFKGTQDAFSILTEGESGDSGGGLWGAVKGFAKGAIKTGKLGMGLLNAMAIGSGLSSMAKGLSSWVDLSRIASISGYDENGSPILDESKTFDINTIIENISTTFTSLSEVFKNPEVQELFDFLSKETTKLGITNLQSMLGGINLTTFDSSKFTSIVDDYIKLIFGMDKPSQANPQKTNFEVFADQIVKISKVADPFEKFVNAFKQFIPEFQKFGEIFKNLGSDNVVAFEKWTSAIDSLITSEEKKRNFESIVDSANKFTSTAFKIQTDSSAAGKNVDEITTADRKDAVTKAVQPPPAEKQTGGTQQPANNLTQRMITLQAQCNDKLDRLISIMSDISETGLKFKQKI